MISVWDQANHAEVYRLYDDNLGHYLNIEDLSLIQVAFYTFLTDKAGRGISGTLAFKTILTIESLNCLSLCYF